MLKRSPGLPSLSSLLIDAQGVHWSQQRMLALGSQLAMLVITMVLITNVIITLGERRLQEEWATQRYSELQTVGTLIADKVTFQQFRTQTFARGESLRQYLDNPGEEEKARLLSQWQSLQKNIPELMGVALFDANGKFRFSSNDVFGQGPVPAPLLGKNRNMGGNEIYTSPMEFLDQEGNLEPYMYQLAWLENPDQSVRGYLVTYNSMLRTLELIKPAISGSQSPMMMFDTQGLLYAGASSMSPLPRLPDTLSGSLRQTYPALWRQMAMSNFGQFHGDDATFVYLKVELTTQYETRREYFLVSYIRNEDIATRFSQWHTLLLVVAILMTVLAAAVIVLSHLFRLEQRSRHVGIRLANTLFAGDTGSLLVNDNGRILSANPAAAKALMLAPDELKDRSLQRCLQLDDEAYGALKQTLQQNGSWRGEVDLGPEEGGVLRVHIRHAQQGHEAKSYSLVTLEEISELAHCQEELKHNQLLGESAVAAALTRADGSLLKTNAAFDQLLQPGELQCHNLAELLENDLGNQWPRIVQQIAMQGQWQGQILCTDRSRLQSCLQATLKGHLDEDGEVEFIVCTLELAAPRQKLRESGDLVPHRSTILSNLNDLEHYFQSLPGKSRNHASLMLLDISPAGMLSHMSDIGQLEKRQQEVEMQLLRDLPSSLQISHWQLGRLVVILPDTHANHAHLLASKTLERLDDNGLGEGICIGIAAFHEGQSLEQFLSNAEVALKRAKQTGEQRICQAFTR
ncbi:PAS domain-containing protein [Shewanella cyperi]|uniref:PAS domain-containing protein n=1 Tax=Shewanella cyperi TaxID=2814292 RepID=A0A974XIZ7_9GAMM|nr:PAS domain-containing protein [Shewanella cyperi]QSX29239.1 PAS domain-containing protein [Shewanella cyperi]